MILGVYQHWMVSDPFERSGPALVFTFMLGGRLVVWYQVCKIQIKTVELNSRLYSNNRQVGKTVN